MSTVSEKDSAGSEPDPIRKQWHVKWKFDIGDDQEVCFICRLDTRNQHYCTLCEQMNERSKLAWREYISQFEEPESSASVEYVSKQDC